MGKAASSDKDIKRSANTEAAERLVQEITHSIAQRSVAARRKRRSGQPDLQDLIQAAALAPATPPAPVIEKEPQPAAAPASAEAEAARVPVLKAEETAFIPYIAPAETVARALPVTPPPEVASPAAPSSPPVVLPTIAVVKEEPVREPFRAARVPEAEVSSSTSSEHRKLALFYFDDPASPIGAYIAGTAEALTNDGMRIDVFSRLPFSAAIPGVTIHTVGEDASDDFLQRVRSFSRRAVAAFKANISDTAELVLMGHEWSSIPALSELAQQFRTPVILSLDSLETQRSDMSSATSREIQKIEVAGLQLASSVLLRKQETHAHATQLVPECASKLTHAHLPFSTRPYQKTLDAGAVKSRYQVGPVDPMILFIGDFDERHGPDVLMKAIPPILKNHRQTHFVFVGDGALQWPLRVHARYLLLENSVRLPGHVGGDALLDLIQAADIVCVPSRSHTEEWPILAAWAAHRPVLTTHAMATGSKLLEHEANSVVAYANENSMVWGVERLLFDEVLRTKLGVNGAKTLEKRFGWSSAAEQIEKLMKAAVTA